MLDIMETIGLWTLIIILSAAGLLMLGAFVAWIGLALVHIGRAFTRGVR